MLKVIEKLFLIISILIILWFSASYIEIIIKNIGDEPHYSFWNILAILFER